MSTAKKLYFIVQHDIKHMHKTAQVPIMNLLSEQTRRERLKSAPYPRLKKRKVFKIVEEGTLWAFWKSSLLQNIKKMKERTFGDIEKFRKKSLTKRKKGRGKSYSAEILEGGTLVGFAFQGRGLWMRSKSSTELVLVKVNKWYIRDEWIVWRKKN